MSRSANPLPPLAAPAAALPALAAGALHEVYAAQPGDGAAALGFAVAAGAPDGRLLWARSRRARHDLGLLHGPGLAQLGLAPGRILAVAAADGMAVLQAGLEGARSAGLAAVLLELSGDSPAYTLTVSRRLALAAQGSGVRLMLVRLGARPVASAAETRWRVSALPSRALAAQAPGHPRFSATLLRHRHGAAGQVWCVEWNRDEQTLVAEPAPIPEPMLVPAGEPAAPALSGAVVSLPAGRTLAPGPSRRRA